MSRTDRSNLEAYALGLVSGLLLVSLLLFFGVAQNIPGTAGLTRADVAEMLYECDIGKYEGYCVADVMIRPSELESEK